MPNKSPRAEMEELLIYFGWDWATNPASSVLNEEDIFLLLSLARSVRYFVGRPKVHVKPTNPWWQRAICDPEYSADSFRSHFRMTQPVFWEVNKLISGHPVFLGVKTPLELQLGVALYRFGTYGNAASLDNVAAKFATSKGSVQVFTKRVIMAITALSKLFIYWPASAERKIIGEGMALKGLPKCVGFVDGTDVGFAAAPVENRDVYWSRKKKYCMQLQIVCDPEKVIRDIFTGYPGSVHDAKIYSISPPGSVPQKLFSEGEYLIGDSAYSLSETVIVPFRRSVAGLTNSQKQFNYHLSKHRVAVEHTIGILKGRFQSLRELRISITKEGHCRALEWTHACAILHNILVKKEPWEDPSICQDGLNEDCNDQTGDDLSQNGVNKRQALFEIFQALN